MLRRFFSSSAGATRAQTFTYTFKSRVLEEVPDLKNVAVTKASVGLHHQCVITQDNQVLSWGNNEYGQCGPVYNLPSKFLLFGRGDEDDILKPSDISTFKDDEDLIMEDVACGNWHSLGLTRDGRVFAWGASPLGNGDEVYDITPTLVTSLSKDRQWKSVEIAASASYSMVLQRHRKQHSLHRTLIWGYVPCDERPMIELPTPKRWTWLKADPDPSEMIRDLQKLLQPVELIRSQTPLWMGVGFNHFSVCMQQDKTHYKLLTFGRTTAHLFDEPFHPVFSSDDVDVNQAVTTSISQPFDVAEVALVGDLKKTVAGAHVNAFITKENMLLVYDLTEKRVKMRADGVEDVAVTPHSMLLIKDGRLIETDLDGFNVVSEHSLEVSDAKYRITAGPTKALIWYNE